MRTHAATPSDSDLPPVATVDQAARFLQVSTKTILRMLEDGRLHGRRTHPARGGLWRIPRENVLAVVAGAAG